MCWLGPCPHDPLRCGLNSSPSHTDAMCNLPQFANSLRGCTVLPCYCFAWHSHVLPWKLGATSLLVVCATVGWVGALYFFPGLPFPRGVSEGRCFSQPAVLKAYTLEPHSVGRTPGGWWFSTGSGPASTVPHGRSGAACRCWLGTWPHDPAVGQHACAG